MRKNYSDEVGSFDFYHPSCDFDVRMSDNVLASIGPIDYRYDGTGSPETRLAICCNEGDWNEGGWSDPTDVGSRERIGMLDCLHLAQYPSMPACERDGKSDEKAQHDARGKHILKSEKRVSDALWSVNLGYRLTARIFVSSCKNRDAHQQGSSCVFVLK